MIEKTLSQIAGDTRTEKPSWETILKLLRMDSATFQTDEEMDLGYDFMCDLIEKHGEQWLAEHRYSAMNQWEYELEKHRKEVEKERKKRRKKRSEIMEPLENETLFDYINRKKGKRYQ